MKSYLKLFVPFALAVLIGSLTFSFAQTKNPNIKRGEFGATPVNFAPGGLHPRLLAQLNLTDAQKTQIAALQENARSSSQEYFDKLRVIEEQLKDLTESGAFDETEARQLLKSKADLQIELEVIRLKTDTAVLNVLTAEQIAKLTQLRQQQPPQFRPNMPPPQN